MNREEILLFLKSHKQELHDRFGVTKIGLFGSYARGDARDDSDIDLWSFGDRIFNLSSGFWGQSGFWGYVLPENGRYSRNAATLATKTENFMNLWATEPKNGSSITQSHREHREVKSLKVKQCVPCG